MPYNMFFYHYIELTNEHEWFLEALQGMLKHDPDGRLTANSVFERLTNWVIFLRKKFILTHRTLFSPSLIFQRLSKIVLFLNR